MKKKALSFFLVCIFLFAFAFGCAPKSQNIKLTLNEVTHSVFYAPFYAALELGYFAQAGIDIDLVNGGGSDKSMSALLSGDAQIALCGPETAIYVYNESSSNYAVIIGQLTKKDGSFLVGKEPDSAFSWEHVRGKTIIGGRVGGMPNMTLEYVLNEQGIAPGKDVTVDSSVQFNLMAGAFEGSNADYVALFEPTASMTELAGKGYLLTSIGLYGGDTPYTAFMVKKDTLAQNATLYQKFTDAVYLGQTYVLTHSAEAVAATIAPQFPESDIALLTRVVENYKAIDCWKSDPVLLREDFEHLQDIIEKAGILTKRADYSAVVDNTFATRIKK